MSHGKLTPDVISKIKSTYRSFKILLESSEKIRLEPGRKLDLASSVLHASFILRDAGQDTDEAKAYRLELLEQHGHDLIHLIDHDGDDDDDEWKDKYEEAAAALAKFVMVLDQTLKSPVEDADKLAHLRETLADAETVDHAQKGLELYQAKRRVARFG